MCKILSLAFALLLFYIGKAQTVSMNASSWAAEKNSAQFVSVDQQASMKLGRGTAWANGIDFTDGIIEVDVLVSSYKSFAGISFRGDNDGTCENIYLRVPLSGRADAIQYLPIFLQQGYWQLYPEHQANYVFPEKGWVHMKIVVSGNTAQLYLDTATVPNLTVNNLRTHNTHGKIGLWCLFEEVFANFHYTPLPPSTNTPVTTSKEEGVFTKYQLSNAFTIGKEAKSVAYPSPSSLHWTTVGTDEDGLLNIGKYRTKQRSDSFALYSNDLVWLKLDLDSDKMIQRKLSFDFSNRVWVFLNGNILYHGDHSWPFYQGIIGKKFMGDALFLPLRKGKNELLIGISSVTNGWGIISKIE